MVDTKQSKLSTSLLVALGCTSGTICVLYLLNQANQQSKTKRKYRPGQVAEYFANLLTQYTKRCKEVYPIRVYLDGCFDVLHFGHANALRQAKCLGDHLAVGLVSDKEVVRCKGPPIMDYNERRIMLDAVRWVDSIIENVPYDVTPEFTRELVTTHKIDYVLHGDDPCTLPDGTDAYAYAKSIGCFKLIKRTEGVSTTNVVGKLMEIAEMEESPQEPPSPHSEPTYSCTSTRRMGYFAQTIPPPPGGKIVYVDGGFDVLHCGHVSFLEAARKLGDYLIVGLHADAPIRARRGPPHPLMTLNDRALALLAVKYVDDVVLDAPVKITNEFIQLYNVSVVVRGTTSESNPGGRVSLDGGRGWRYDVARDQYIFKQVTSPNPMTVRSLVKRVQGRDDIQQKIKKKKAKESTYYEMQRDNTIQEVG